MRKTLVGIILLVAVALLAACGGGASTTPGGGGDSAASGGADTAAIKEGGIFRLGTTSNPDSMNPFVGFSALSYIPLDRDLPDACPVRRRLQDHRRLGRLVDNLERWQGLDLQGQVQRLVVRR